MRLQLNLLNKLIFPEVIYKLPETDKKVYLTFDDGPTPGITSRVLAFLSQYNAKATFFCTGANVEKNIELFRKIKAEGHTTANHGYSHLHGWHTKTQNYTDDCNRSFEVIKSLLFRPPYGKMTFEQYNTLKNQYSIILWSALSWDFHPWVSREWCLSHSLRNMYPGSILVFHDNLKAADKLLYVLPRLLEEGGKKGYRFVGI